MKGRAGFFIRIVMMAVLFASCAGKPPSPAKPTNIILEIEGSADLNPDPGARPAPLALRVYELKSPSGFKSADFISLYKKDEGVLGADLVRKHELTLQPKEKKTLQIEAANETRAIGAFAVFRSYERAQWRGSADIQPHATTVVHIKVGRDSLTLEASLQKPPDAK